MREERRRKEGMGGRRRNRTVKTPSRT